MAEIKVYMDVAGKSICIIYCAFVIYSESLLIPTTMKLTTAACHIPIRYVHYLIVLWLRHVDYSGMHQPV